MPLHIEHHLVLRDDADALAVDVGFENGELSQVQGPPRAWGAAPDREALRRWDVQGRPLEHQHYWCLRGDARAGACGTARATERREARSSPLLDDEP